MARRTRSVVSKGIRRSKYFLAGRGAEQHAPRMRAAAAAPRRARPGHLPPIPQAWAPLRLSAPGADRPSLLGSGGGAAGALSGPLPGARPRPQSAAERPAAWPQRARTAPSCPGASPRMSSPAGTRNWSVLRLPSRLARQTWKFPVTRFTTHRQLVMLRSLSSKSVSRMGNHSGLTCHCGTAPRCRTGCHRTGSG